MDSQQIIVFHNISVSYMRVSPTMYVLHMRYMLYRQRDRHTKRHTDIQTYRHTDRQTER